MGSCWAHGGTYIIFKTLIFSWRINFMIHNTVSCFPWSYRLHSLSRNTYIWITIIYLSLFFQEKGELHLKAARLFFFLSCIFQIKNLARGVALFSILKILFNAGLADQLHKHLFSRQPSYLNWQQKCFVHSSHFITENNKETQASRT